MPSRYRKYVRANRSPDAVNSRHYTEYKNLVNEEMKETNDPRITPKNTCVAKTEAIETKHEENDENYENRNRNILNNDRYESCEEPKADYFYDEEENEEYEDEFDYHDNHCNDMDKECMESFDSGWYGSAIVCKFYNPYFNSGCKQRECEYAHLSLAKYQIYCRIMREQNQMDAFSQRKFEDAISYIKGGFTIQALKIFRHLVTDYEYDAGCHFWMGRCYSSLEDATFKDLELAEFYFKKAIALHPKRASFHSYFAGFMLRLAAVKKRSTECVEHKQAKIHIAQAMTLKPAVMKYILQYAKFLDEVDCEFVEAKKYYKQAIKISPMDRRIRLNYARLLHKMGNFRASRKEFGTIFEISTGGLIEDKLHSEWIWPHFHYAKLLVDMRYYKEAKKEFEICIDIMEAHNHRYFADIYYEFAKLSFNHLNNTEHAYYCISQAKLNNKHNKPYYDELLHSIENVYYSENRK